MTIREQLQRARPRVDGPTYRYVRGDITKAEYQEALNAERQKHGLPRITPAEEGNTASSR